MSRLVFATLLQWVADVSTIAHWPRRFQATKKNFVIISLGFISTLWPQFIYLVFKVGKKSSHNKCTKNAPCQYASVSSCVN